jgi:hypothetical protein
MFLASFVVRHYVEGHCECRFYSYLIARKANKKMKSELNKNDSPFKRIGGSWAKIAGLIKWLTIKIGVLINKRQHCKIAAYYKEATHYKKAAWRLTIHQLQIGKPITKWPPMATLYKVAAHNTMATLYQAAAHYKMATLYKKANHYKMAAHNKMATHYKKGQPVTRKDDRL